METQKSTQREREGDQHTTVDGRHPAPVVRWSIPLFTVFQPL